MTERRTFNCQERQAILLLEKLEREGRGIPRAMQKRLSAKELCSWFDADHWPILHIDGGTTHPSNGQMLLNDKGARRLSWILELAVAREHREKTNRDIAEHYKSKRISSATEEMRRRLLAKTQPDVEPQHKPTSRLSKPPGKRYDWRQRRYVSVAKQETT